MESNSAISTLSRLVKKRSPRLASMLDGLRANRKLFRAGSLGRGGRHDILQARVWTLSLFASRMGLINATNGSLAADMNNETERLPQGMAVIERTYRAIWNDWFEGMSAPRSDFCVTHDCADSGYRPKKNELLLSLPELNVEEASDDLRTIHNI